MSTIFAKIISGEIPAHKIVETQDFYSFLDANPIEKGHVLVVPKKEGDYIFDMDSSSYAGLFLFAKRVAKAIEKTVKCKRIGVCVLGLEVPHTHIHLVPLISTGYIDFTAPKKSYESEVMAKLASNIADNFE